MPAINHFQERKLLKTVLELRDKENLICYAYLWAENPGKLVYIGKCIGFGIPYATEFTNPQKRSDFLWSTGGETSGASLTWQRPKPTQSGIAWHQRGNLTLNYGSESPKVEPISLWIVGSFGDTRSAEVLFEQAGSRGNVKAVKKIRQRRLHISSTIKARDDRTNNATDMYIASTIRGCDFNPATARGQTNFVAQTINAGKRGNAGRIWEDTYIAETDADRKGKTDGV